MDHSVKKILTLNSGSSSIKFSLYRMAEAETLVVDGSVQGIGSSEGSFVAARAGEAPVRKALKAADHGRALAALLEWLNVSGLSGELDAVGHRIVHGGTRFSRPHPVTGELLSTLRELVHLAPEHLPHQIRAIETVAAAYPSLAQAACFDTAFHSRMPKRARMYGLPRGLYDKGIMRYGFHGLSYEYILQELSKTAGPAAANGRLIVAHLGHGASMAAVRQGQCLDTSMGFTPTAGLVMSSRSGDLDPGMIPYLIETERLSPSALRDLLNKESGLLGVSGISRDMKTLLEEEKREPRAGEAVDLFCYQAGKFAGAFAAVLGGLETLVFTGGIGENAPEIRRRICEPLGFLGVYLDRGANAANEAIISLDESPVTVRVMRTNEERMIARHTLRVIFPDTMGEKKKGDENG